MTTDEVNRLLLELQEVKIQQAVTITKLDQALAENVAGQAVHQSLDARITALERWKYGLMGAVFAGAALGTGGTAALFKALGG